MRIQNVLLLLFSTLLIRELWTLIPYSSETHSYFPLIHKELTLRTYIYFPCEIIADTIIIYVLWMSFAELAVVFKIWFWLQIVEFVDYFITYNMKWFTLSLLHWDIDFGITLLRMIILFIIISTKLISWKT